MYWIRRNYSIYFYLTLLTWMTYNYDILTYVISWRILSICCCSFSIRFMSAFSILCISAFPCLSRTDNCFSKANSRITNFLSFSKLLFSCACILFNRVSKAFSRRSFSWDAKLVQWWKGRLKISLASALTNGLFLSISLVVRNSSSLRRDAFS